MASCRIKAPSRQSRPLRGRQSIITDLSKDGFGPASQRKARQRTIPKILPLFLRIKAARPVKKPRCMPLRASIWLEPACLARSETWLGCWLLPSRSMRARFLGSSGLRRFSIALMSLSLCSASSPGLDRALKLDAMKSPSEKDPSISSSVPWLTRP
jgi:hypothetical protein